MTAWERRCLYKRIKHSLLAPFEWLGILLGLLVLAPMPHCVMYAICDFAAFFYWLFDHEGRLHAEENLDCIFPGDRRPVDPVRRRLIIRRSYRNMARTIGHIFWTSFNARRRVPRVAALDAETKAFLAANRQAVVLTIHLGCWEVTSQLALLEGHTMMSVAKKVGTHGMTGILMKARKSIGQEIVAADGAFKALMKGMREGRTLGLVVDQTVPPDKGGVWIRFLGRPFPVTAAPAFFAAKAKVPLGMFWARPLRNGHYRIEKLGEIPVEESRDLWLTTQRVQCVFERLIRRHPSLWVLNYNYFREPVTPEVIAELEKKEAKHAE